MTGAFRLEPVLRLMRARPLAVNPPCLDLHPFLTPQPFIAPFFLEAIDQATVIVMASSKVWLAESVTRTRIDRVPAEAAEPVYLRVVPVIENTLLLVEPVPVTSAKVRVLEEEVADKVPTVTAVLEPLEPTGRISLDRKMSVGAPKTELALPMVLESIPMRAF